MRSVAFRIETLAPLILSSVGGSLNMVRSKDHIPGGVVRGLFAAEYIKARILPPGMAHEDRNFFDWFLSGKLCFGNAYIGIEESPGKWASTIPMPLSIHREKHDELAIHDLLFEDPDVPTRPLGGYARIIRDKTDIIQRMTIRTKLNFHHRRDEERGVPAHGGFFNYESLSEGQSFLGDIQGENKTLDSFYEKFSNCPALGETHIGRSRNSQYGKIRFSFCSGPAEMKQSSETYENELSLTLLAPAIILNKDGFPSTDPYDLMRESGFSTDVEIKKSFIKTGEIEGFVSAWKLRRPAAICFQAGSCFLLKMGDAPMKTLKLLESEGIGERREDGFGRLAFGIQRNGEIHLGRGSNDRVSGPDAQASFNDESRSIVMKIIENELVRRVDSAGREDADGFQSLPTKALIHRLEDAALRLEDAALGRSSHGLQSLLRDLKKPARHKLENSHDGKKDLYEHLKATENMMDWLSLAVRHDPDPLYDLLKDSRVKGMNIPSDEALQQKMKQTYHRAFFATLRRKAAGTTGGTR